LNLPLYQPTKIKTDEFKDFFAALTPCGGCGAYGQNPAKWLLEIPRWLRKYHFFALGQNIAVAAPVAGQLRTANRKPALPR